MHERRMPPRPPLPAVHFQNKAPPSLAQDTPIGKRVNSTVNRRHLIVLVSISFFSFVLIYFIVTETHSSQQLHKAEKGTPETTHSNIIIPVATIVTSSPIVANTKEIQEAAIIGKKIVDAETETSISVVAAAVVDKKNKNGEIREKKKSSSDSSNSNNSSATSAIPTYSLTKSGRVTCVDLIPTSDTSTRLFDYPNDRRFSTFHACLVKEIWISGSNRISGEAHFEQAIIFPPAPPAKDNDEGNDGTVASSNNNNKKKEEKEFVPYPRTKFDFPITPFNTPYNIIVSEQNEETERHELRFANDGKRVALNLNAIDNNYEKNQKSNGKIKLNVPQHYDNKAEDKILAPSQHFYHKEMIRQFAAKKFVPGVTLVVSPHYCCRHPMHFLEGLGATSVALDRWLEYNNDNKKDSSLSSSSSKTTTIRCPKNESDLSLCFSKLQEILVYSGNGANPEGFPAHFARSVVFAAFGRANYPPQAALQIPITSIQARNFHYEKLLFVGARYDIWPNQEIAKRSVHDFRNYLEYRKKNGLATFRDDHGEDDDEKQKKKNKKNKKQNQQQEKDALATTTTASTNANKAKRKIVYMKRNSGRSIVDQDDFIKFLDDLVTYLVDVGENNNNNNNNNEERNSLDFEYQILAINALEHTVDELYEILGDAKIILGIHGADLTNMLFMKPTSAMNDNNEKPPAIIEINPVFFFEPRFYDISRRLGFGYFSYNCGSPRCAFGGNRLLFRAHMPLDIGFDEQDNHRLTYQMEVEEEKDVNGGPKQKVMKEFSAHWPVSGYVGEICGRPCLDLVDRTSMQGKFFSTFRGSNVAMTTTPTQRRDFAGIFYDAVISVGWGEHFNKNKNNNEKEMKRKFLKRVL